MPKPPNYDEKKDGKWKGRKPGSYKWYEIQDTIAYFKEFEKPKIVYPTISKEPRFSYDDNKLFFADTTFIIPRKDFFLLSLLNSKLIYWIFQKLCSTLGDVKKGGRIQLKPIYYSDFPIIRKIKNNTSIEEKENIVSKLKELYEKNEYTTILSNIGSYISYDSDEGFNWSKEKSDVIHDFLGFLAQMMIKIKLVKNKEVNRFHRWLEKYLNMKIENCVGKEKIKNYFFQTYDDFLKNLSKNKIEIKVDLKEEFNSSKNLLKPTLKKIEETDSLIDNIIYKLYGLTKKEISLIEESLKN